MLLPVRATDNIKAKQEKQQLCLELIFRLLFSSDWCFFRFMTHFWLSNPSLESVPELLTRVTWVYVSQQKKKHVFSSPEFPSLVKCTGSQNHVPSHRDVHMDTCLKLNQTIGWYSSVLSMLNGSMLGYELLWLERIVSIFFARKHMKHIFARYKAVQWTNSYFLPEFPYDVKCILAGRKCPDHSMRIRIIEFLQADMTKYLEGSLWVRQFLAFCLMGVIRTWDEFP